VACGDGGLGEAVLDAPMGAVRRGGRGDQRYLVVVGDAVVGGGEHHRHLQPPGGC
jgi:hypothetical protein